MRRACTRGGGDNGSGEGGGWERVLDRGTAFKLFTAADSVSLWTCVWISSLCIRRVVPSVHHLLAGATCICE